jgi:hypothetical protein
MQRVTMIDMVRTYIRQDPVRPHIEAESRIALGREMYHIDESAVICLACVDRVPVSEVEVFGSQVGNIAVAYTVWSLKKGLGRKIISETQKRIQDTFRYYLFLPFLSDQTVYATAILPT